MKDRDAANIYSAFGKTILTINKNNVRGALKNPQKNQVHASHFSVSTPTVKQI